jgi:myo-inositol-1(or 4)-monophosphatase
VELRPHLELAVEIAYEAGRLSLGHFRTGTARQEFKEDETPVTVADREAERLIRDRIHARYPRHTIVGEEYGSEEGAEAGHRWIVDPIDGTKAFVRGVPLYSVLIGLEVDGTCEVGAAYFPALDEMLCAATGEGCYLNGRRVRVSETQRLRDGIVCFTDAKGFGRYGREEDWQRVLVATGRTDLMLDPALNPWDAGPFPPILREAGGYFGDWSGNETIYADEGISTTQTLLSEVLDLFREDE